MKTSTHTHSRPIRSEADKLAMSTLAHEARPAQLHVADLPWRLSSWALDEPENTRLWYDAAGRMLGWAVLQTPFWTIDYICHPEAEEHLHPEILAWSESRARACLQTSYGHPFWIVVVFSDQGLRIRQLEAAGFANQADVGEDSWSKVYLERPASLPVSQAALADGFTIRPLAGKAEVPAYVEMHQRTFESKNMQVGWRLRTLQHPHYRPDLDLVAVAPDGRLAAFCIGWLDGNDPSIGQIEPMGVHPDFRKYGLGWVVLAECMRRLQAHGVTRIVLETDLERNAALLVYKSSGFQIRRDVLVYRKDFG